MARIETITMSMSEIDRLKTIQAVVDGNLKPMVAAVRLNLTARQVQRLVNRYRSEDVDGVTSLQHGRTGNRQLAPGLANLVLTVLRERYADFGPTLLSISLQSKKRGRWRWLYAVGKTVLAKPPPR